MREKGWQDADAEFLRRANAVNISSNGAVFLITADGQHLGKAGGRKNGLQKALQAWEALPESRRRPGAVKIESRGRRDKQRLALSPPAGCLILRVCNREFRREGKHLRYLNPDDFGPDLKAVTAERFAESRQDFMWVLEGEWKSLVPDNVQSGYQITFPESLTLRILRNHLNPLLGLRGGMCFRRAAADSAELIARVFEASSEHIHLEVTGHAGLRQDDREGAYVTYAPAIRGDLEFDRRTKKLTKFDLVAFGELIGTLPGIGKESQPQFERPFGVAFELILNPTPAERLRPHGAGKDIASYLRPAP